ncbi:MAG: hypothetical protein U5N55_01475 [Cypionkella sp.]|nr:hypothetical protein [Cypionkella sp.]
MTTRNASLPVTQTWSEITNGETLTTVVFENTGSTEVIIQATASGTAPDATQSGLVYGVKMGEAQLISVLFPGVAGANRLWARTQSGQSSVFISHA